MSAYLNAPRDWRGLAVTIAVHVGFAAIGLVAIGQVMAPKSPPAPIIVKQIPATPVPPQKLPVPTTPTDQPIIAMVEPPIVTIDDPAPIDPGFTRPILGDPQPPRADPIIIRDPEPVVTPGPTRNARLDRGGTSQPLYPSAARRLGEEGAVVLDVTIGSDGAVLDVRLLTSSGSPRLDAAALDHARARWHFSPALKDGTAIVSHRTLTVHFRLADA